MLPLRRELVLYVCAAALSTTGHTQCTSWRWGGLKIFSSGFRCDKAFSIFIVLAFIFSEKQNKVSFDKKPGIIATRQSNQDVQQKKKMARNINKAYEFQQWRDSAKTTEKELEQAGTAKQRKKWNH